MDISTKDVIHNKLLSKSCNKLMVTNHLSSGVIFESIDMPFTQGVLRLKKKTKARLLAISFESRSTIMDMIKIQNVVIKRKAVAIITKHLYLKYTSWVCL